MNLNVDDKHLNSLIKTVVTEKLGASITTLKFIGGGSNVRFIALKPMTTENLQLRRSE